MDNKRSVFCFNPHDNGGEAIMLTTSVEEDNFVVQEISLESYGNSASITIGCFLTPDMLRKCADEIETFLKEHPNARV